MKHENNSELVLITKHYISIATTGDGTNVSDGSSVCSFILSLFNKAMLIEVCKYIDRNDKSKKYGILFE